MIPTMGTGHHLSPEGGGEDVGCVTNISGN